MIKELKQKLIELKEIRARAREHANDTSYPDDLRNIFKGQCIELLNQINYIKYLIKKLEG